MFTIFTLSVCVYHIRTVFAFTIFTLRIPVYLVFYQVFLFNTFTLLFDEYLLSSQCTFNIGLIKGQWAAGCYGNK